MYNLLLVNNDDFYTCILNFLQKAYFQYRSTVKATHWLDMLNKS